MKYAITLFILVFNFPFHQTFAQKNLRLHTLAGHQSNISQAQISKNGQIVVSADQDKTVKIWSVQTGICLQTIRGIRHKIIALSISPNGHYVAVSSHNKMVKIWSTVSGMLKFSKKIGYITDLVFSPDSRYLLTNKNSEKLNPLGLLVGQIATYKVGTIKIWDLKTGKKINKFNVKKNVSSVVFSPDGHYIATGGTDKKLKVWQTLSGQLIYSIAHSERITRLQFSPHGKFIAVYMPHQLTLLRNARDGSLAKSAQFNQAVKKLYFTPQSKYLVALSSYNNLQVYDIAKDKLLPKRSTLNTIQDLYLGKQEVIAIEKAQGHQLLLKAYYDLFLANNETYIRNHVKAKITQWQKKGKFEKTADYQRRVTPENRQRKVQEFTQQVINALAQKDLNWKRIKNEYDADNETFKIIADDRYTFYIKVPIADAKQFDANFAHTRFENPQFILNADGNFVLTHVELNNRILSKKYSYDNQQAVRFNSKNLAIKLKPFKVKVPKTKTTPPGSRTTPQPVWKTATVDLNLPFTQMQNSNAVAVVIGNRNYLKTKAVKYAINDAKSIKEYLIKVLGFREGNIFYQENATKGDFEVFFGNASNYKGKLYNTIKPGKSDVFVFYSGHGAPDTKNFKGYFVPVECDPQYVSLAGYAIDLFYTNLAKLPARSVTVVLDACFSGAEILQNISPIGIKSKGIKGIKNGVLLASSKGSQVSSWYNDQQHGLFTYFFLKAIHNKNADVNKDNELTFKEIYQYISDQSEGIPYWARRLHNVEQVPILQGKDQKRVLVKY